MARPGSADGDSLEWLLDLRPQVRSALINELPRHRRAEDEGGAVDAQVFLLAHDPVANFRSRAASGLDPNHSAQVRDALIAALDDENPDVRRFACQSLSLSEDRSVAEHVMPLLDDASPETRRMAVRVLGELGASEALPRIRELYQQVDPSDARATSFASAFSRLGDEAMALRAVEPLLGHENWNIRHSMVSDLGHLDSREIVPMLIGTLAAEMRLELQENVHNNFQLPTRVMRTICELLDDRTGASIGVDPRGWMDWWAKHSVAYGVPADQAEPPAGYEALCKRYMQAVESGNDSAYEPPTDQAHLTARRLGPDESVALDKWSEVSNGLRIRLFAPSSMYFPSDLSREAATVARSNDADDERLRLVLALHNTTEQPLVMPIPRFAREIALEGELLQKRDVIRHASLSGFRRPDGALSINAKTVMLWAIELQPPRRTHESEYVAAAEFPAHKERIDVPADMPLGRYAVSLTIDLSAADEHRVLPEGEPTTPHWRGKLVTPPIVIEFKEVESSW